MDMDFLVRIISPIVAVMLFWLGQLSISWKSAREQSKYNDQIILAFKNELSENFSNINNVRQILQRDLADLKQGKVAITPLLSFQFTSWDHARFGRADFLYKAETKDYMKLTNCYFILHILQEKIRNREQNRLFLEGKPTFVERMELLDRDILDKLDHAQQTVRDAQAYLDKIHKWVVKGESFSLDKGVVVEFKK